MNLNNCWVNDAEVLKHKSIEGFKKAMLNSGISEKELVFIYETLNKKNDHIGTTPKSGENKSTIGSKVGDKSEGKGNTGATKKSVG